MIYQLTVLMYQVTDSNSAVATIMLIRGEYTGEAVSANTDNLHMNIVKGGQTNMCTKYGFRFR